MEFMDLYSHLIPVYQIEPLEKITDAYLDQARAALSFSCRSLLLIFISARRGACVAALAPGP